MHRRYHQIYTLLLVVVKKCEKFSHFQGENCHYSTLSYSFSSYSFSHWVPYY